jgi:tetratricopeptide (TPR) repeat protein
VRNAEIGRTVLIGGVGSDVRRDIEIDWHSVTSGNAPPGVISAKNAYQRSADANKALNKALAAAKAKKDDEALNLFKEIVEKDPKDFVAWAEMGTLYFARSKYTDAEAAYGKALEQKADYLPAWMNLGKLYLSQRNLDLAVNAFLRAANAEPTSADAFMYLGESYLQAKQGSKAVIALNEALRLEPQAMADAHLRLATLYDAAGAKDRASAEYKIFLQKRPNHPDRQKLADYIKANLPK